MSVEQRIYDSLKNIKVRKPIVKYLKSEIETYEREIGKQLPEKMIQNMYHITADLVGLLGNPGISDQEIEEKLNSGELEFLKLRI